MVSTLKLVLEGVLGIWGSDSTLNSGLNLTCLYSKIPNTRVVIPKAANKDPTIDPKITSLAISNTLPSGG